ncbi:MAG: hypothetical protein JOZ70_11700 [Pseudolabrys sp.]|nr:hypothetical protein [Pseudolabrys sp.]
MQKEHGKYFADYQAFQKFLKGERLPLSFAFRAFIKLPVDVLEWILRYFPGPFGYKSRAIYYGFRLKHLGKNVLIDTGVMFSGHANISIGDYVWIDANCMIGAALGEISIGRRVHVGPFSIIAAHEKVTLENYVGLSSGVRIYSGSEAPRSGKRMSGPMLPEEYRGFRTGPVHLKKDSFVGSNSVILPGVTLGEGAVVGACAVIRKDVEPFDVVVGDGRVIGRRDPVTSEEI